MISRKTQDRACECCGTTPHPAGWEVLTRMKVHGRTVEPGTVLSIKGERGTFRFTRLVRNRDNGASWIDCVGGTDQLHPKTAVTMFRAFNPETIKTVHNPPKVRPAR